MGTHPAQTGTAPIFGPCLLWPKGWMDQDATRYRGMPRPRRHCVRWGSSSPNRGTLPPLLDPYLFRKSTPTFGPMFFCGQTARWIKMSLGTEVDLGPAIGHTALHGASSSPLESGTAAALFGPCLMWPNGRPSQILLSLTKQ